MGHQGVVFGVDLDDSTQQAFTASGDKVGERERERAPTVHL